MARSEPKHTPGLAEFVAKAAAGDNLHGTILVEYRAQWRKAHEANDESLVPTATSVAKALGIPASTVSTHVRKMYDAGILAYVGGNRTGRRYAPNETEFTSALPKEK